MLHLAHGNLQVDLLDPTADAIHLGPRFCAGGYIWQVHDANAGPLLSGPEGPDPQPAPFNGHGLPESFRERTRDGKPLLWNVDRGEALAPGAGRLVRRDGSVVLDAPCVWNVSLASDSAEFRTNHEAGGFACSVTRRITLRDRRLESHSTLTNTGAAAMNLQWFAHPFFALDAEGGIEVRIPVGTKVPAGSGFLIGPDDQLRPARRHQGKDDGAFALLDLPAAPTMGVQVSHPRLPEGIHFSTTFAPSECPVWVNGHTFSIEPYQRLELAPGESREWTLGYEFGESRSRS